MAHLTYFDTVAEYNAYINSEDFVSPNVSYCADADVVFMKENFVPSVSAVFNVASTGATNIAGTTANIKGIRVDGQVLAQNVTAYTFETTGNHTVEYQFRKQNAIPDKVFYNCSALTSVNISNISRIGNDNFSRCENVQFGDLVVNGSIGDNCFTGISGLTSIVVNGNIGNSNLTGNFSLQSVRINGSIGNNNIAGVSSLTDLYIDGNIGNTNFGGVSSITSMTINGSSVGNNNYFSGFDTLHIKGDLGDYNSIYNIKHIIVDGNMGNSNNPGSGLEDIVVKGNIGNSNIGGISTLSAITISGDVGTSNFGGCTPINTMKIGGNVDTSNFSNSWHQYDSVEIGGDVAASNNFNCQAGNTSNITISGNVDGGACVFFSGGTLVVKGDFGSHSVYFWHNVTIEGNLTGGGVGFTGVENVRIKGNVTNGGIGWGTQSGFEKQSFIIDGSIIGGGCFNGITGPMIQVGGSIAGGCFQSISVTDVTNYTVHGDLGTSCFNNVTGLTSVTVDGDVGANSFGKTYTSTNSISSLTLTENCTSYGGYSGDTTCALLSLTIQALTPPTLENTLPTTVEIYVPASAVDTYKAASGWSTYASQIQAIPTE